MIDRLAWVTTKGARGRDEDEPLALAALARAGVDVAVVDWDDASVDWASYDRVAIRSTWDYPQRLTEFLGWLDAVDAVTELVNPIDVVRWNLDKHYLSELADAHVPVVPTVFVEPGGTPVFPGSESVVKPAVGAGSRDVSSYGPGQDAAFRAHVGRLHARGESVLVQPLLAAVATHGEWPLVFFNGRLSHAASKRVVLPPGGVEDLFAAETTAPHVADDEQIGAAQAAMDVVSARFGESAYARVDLVRDDDDRHCVLEIELIEPSLFLPQAEPAAADRLAEALIS